MGVLHLSGKPSVLEHFTIFSYYWVLKKDEKYKSPALHLFIELLIASYSPSKAGKRINVDVGAKQRL